MNSIASYGKLLASISLKKSAGISPLSLFFDKLIYHNRFKEPISSGMDPVNLFSLKSRVLKLSIRFSDDGIDPLKLFDFSSNVVSLFSLPICDEIGPEILLNDKSKDVNFVKEASKKFGSQCIVVAIDAKKISEKKWNVFTHGGRNKTEIDAIEFAKDVEKNGAGEILLTSMDKDGTKSGYDVDLLKSITECTNIPVIASGGVGTLDHLYDGIVKGGASAVLAASIFHYGEFKIKEAKEYLNSKNVSVRL